MQRKVAAADSPHSSDRQSRHCIVAADKSTMEKNTSSLAQLEMHEKRTIRKPARFSQLKTSQTSKISQNTIFIQNNELLNVKSENNLLKKHKLKSLRVNITRLSQKLIDSHTIKQDEQTTNFKKIKLEPNSSDFNLNAENIKPLAIKLEPHLTCSEAQNLEPPEIKCEADVDLTCSEEQLTSELMIKDEHVECSEVEHVMQGEWIQKSTVVNNLIVCKNCTFSLKCIYFFSEY
jgi:hypothetical protein